VFRVQETGAKTIAVFTTNEKGEVLLGGNADYKICDLTTDFTTVTVTVDFENATITAYDSDGVVAKSSDGRDLVLGIKKPTASEAADLVDFISYTKYHFVWYGYSTAGQLLIDDLTITSGKAFVVPSGSESTRIVYVGATVPEDAPKEYDPSGVTPLPALADIEGKKFAGWYSDTAFATPISEIPEGTKGTAIVYARWISVSFEDYENVNIDLSNPDGVNNGSKQNKKYGDLTYYTSAKAGASFKTESDGQGNSYLVFTKGAQDPQINKDGPLCDFLGAETQITLSLDLALNGDASAFGFVILLRKSGADNFSLLTLDASGNVYLGSSSSGLKIGTIGKEFTTYTVTFDFKTGILSAVDKDGNVVKAESGEDATLVISVPKASAATTMLEWLKTLQNYNFVMYSGGAGTGSESLRFDNITFIGGII